MRPSEALRSKIRQIESISKFLDRKKIECLARESKFIQRSSALSGMDFFILCVFAHQQCDQISLEGMCAELLKNGVRITKQSLQDRFNDNAVAFMREVLNESLALKFNVGPMISLQTFKRITILDSTQIELPESFCIKYKGSGGGASASSLKLQYGFDVVSQKIIVILMQNGVQADHSQQLQGLEENDLRIEDLGYFRLQRFEQIINAKAFFLSRYRHNVTVYQWQGQQFHPVNLLKLEKSMRPGERKTINAFLGLNEKLAVRMIIEKVPPKIANEKRRKLKTDKQNKRKNISSKRLSLCNLNIYVTNTSEQQIPSDQVRSYYSLRWQVEIIFKAWKSVYHIDHIRTMKLQRFECVHLGTLILIVLTTNLMSFCKRNLYARYKKELSELKFFKLLKASMAALQQAVINPRKQLLEFLDMIESLAYRNSIKEAKSNKDTPFAILKIAA